MPSQRLDYINGLRAVAIMGVVWHHGVNPHLSGGPNPVSFLRSVGGIHIDFGFWTNSGWLGVNLFFFLSGFVLMLPFARGERQMETLANAGAFLKRRAVRLLPLYYLCGAVMFGLFYRHTVDRSGQWVGDWLPFLTGTFIFDTTTFFPRFNWVYWSLGIEIWFSILFPLIVFGHKRVPLWAMLLVSAIVATILRVEAHKVVGAQLIHGAADGVIHRLPDLLFGALAAKVFVSGRLNWALRSYVSCVVGLALILATMVAFYHWSHGRLPLHVGAWLPLVLDTGVFLLTLFLLIRRPVTFGFLTIWPVQIIGLACYSIYAWHGPLLSGININTLAEVQSHWHAYVIALIGIALASYVFIEFPKKDWRELFLIPATWRLPRFHRAAVRKQVMVPGE